MEIALYTIYSVFIIISYFVCGYKFIQTNSNALKIHTQIWLISVIIVVFSFVDVKMASLLNLPFQPLSVLFNNYVLNEKMTFTLTSLFPSSLIQAGYIYKLNK
jgi:hypothetical protein